MKKYIIPLMLAASMTGFFACTPEKELRSALEAGGIITANAGDVEDDLETKTTMVYKFDITWKAGDKIYVQDNNGNYDNYVLKSGAGTTRAAFQKANEEWCKGKPSGNAWAFYPAEWYSNGSYDWPSVQTTSSTMPMYAATTLDACQNGDIEFQSIGSVFQIVFTSLTPGKTLKSIRVEDASKAMSGQCTLSASREFQFSDTHGAITLDLGDGTSLGTTAKYFNIILPPGKYTNVTVTFTATDGTQCRKNSTSFPTMKKATVHKIAMSGEFTHGAVQLWEDGPYWATMNIGSSSPEENGLYFTWGNVAGYSPSGSTFSYSFDESSYTGTPGSLLTVDIPRNAEYDAAQALWGSDWKIPTNADFQELINNCDISWGDTGILFTGKGSYSDRSIFIPAAGLGSRTSLNNVGLISYYWSRTDYGSGAACNFFFNVNTKLIQTSRYPRYYGQAIRPVKCDPPGPVSAITLDRTSLNMELGGYSQLTATVLPEDASHENLIWASSDESIVTVSSTGLLHAEDIGQAVITVKCDMKTVTCIVTVRDHSGVQLWEYSPLWAQTNIGAGSPEDYGLYFSWANIDGYLPTGNRLKYAFNSSNYSETTGSSLRSDIPLKSADYDAAQANWGGDWRIPTKEEYQNLIDNCVWTWIDGETLNFNNSGKPGYLIRGKGSYSDNTIFLPAEGLASVNPLGSGSQLGSVGTNGYYWSGKYTFSNTSYCINFDEGSKALQSQYRYKGLAIRPVKGDLFTPVTGIELDKTEVVLSLYESAQINATVSPSNATDKNVIWTSDNESVATVDNTGRVYAKSFGFATISAITKEGDHRATCAVTVTRPSYEPLPGKFSVADGKQVQFSKGNLQATYDGSKYIWDFAAKQYDYIGDAAGNTTIDSQTIGSVVDMFGWSSPATYFGINASYSYPTYSGDFVDWGQNIGDGSTWRTLSKDEWYYLMWLRPNSGRLLKSHVTVCGKPNCLIFAPDGFTGTIATSYDASTWPAAEAAGLICLPATGYRYGLEVRKVGETGNYWTSTPGISYSHYSYYCAFGSKISVLESSRVYSNSVRLVTDVK